MAFGVFLILPFTQVASNSLKKNLLLTRVDTSSLTPPNEAPPPPEPPPKQEEPPEPPPSMADVPQDLSLNVPELDVAVGMGGVLPGQGNPFGAAGDALTELTAFSVSDLDQVPSLISSPAPVYPRELLKAKVQGGVSLLFVVDESGRVEDPRVESSSHADFERPALEAIRRWKFKPGMKDGAAVKTYLRLPMKFKINS